MSERSILSLKPALRLEWRGQDGQSETEQPDHSASLGDSITLSTRIRFSVHTVPFRHSDRHRSGRQQGHRLSTTEDNMCKESYIHDQYSRDNPPQRRGQNDAAE
jgi:hypothetical protein